MKYSAIAFGLLLVLTARTSAQQRPSAGELSGFSGRPDRCLVVSRLGGKFLFRDSWFFQTNKRAFKDSDLTKIQRSGIDVIRLPKNATDADVKTVIIKCQQTLLDPVPAFMLPPPDQPRVVPISEEKIQ
jgi:hypothetical protein